MLAGDAWRGVVGLHEEGVVDKREFGVCSALCLRAVAARLGGLSPKYLCICFAFEHKPVFAQMLTERLDSLTFLSEIT